MHNKEVSDFIGGALEASIYVSPRSPGLSSEEIQEVASRAGYRHGEISDAMRSVILIRVEGSNRFVSEPSPFSVDFLQPIEPDYRSLDAFEFVRVYFRDLAAEVGESMARADRGLIVADGIAKGIDEHSLEIALTMLMLVKHLTKHDSGAYACAPGKLRWALPSAQRANWAKIRMPPRRRPKLELAYGIVKDVVERRTDGRAPAAEPIKAFEHALNGLDCARFRMWWAQTSGELQRANAETCPMTVCVLSAALAEGALVLIVKRAQGRPRRDFRHQDERARSSAERDP
jgi:hypothetical protein